MIKFNKIFGIGLGKTGLHSLASALNILGIKALQNWKRAGRDINSLFKRYEFNDIKVLREPCLKAYGAFIPGAGSLNILLMPRSIYKQLDKEYLNSKFILTIRDLDSWLISTKKHIERNQRNPDYKGNSLIFKKDELIKRWETYNQDVLNYFKNRSDDLLVINICGGDGWEKLCSFLEMPVPDVPFPHKNSAAEHEMRAKSRMLSSVIKNYSNAQLFDNRKQYRQISYRR